MANFGPHLWAKAHKLEKLRWHATRAEWKWKRIWHQQIFAARFRLHINLTTFALRLRCTAGDSDGSGIGEQRYQHLWATHTHTQVGGVAGLVRREGAVDKPASKSKSWTRFMCFARLCDNKTKQNKTEHKLRLEMAGHSYDSRGRVYDTGSRTLPSRHKY